MRRPTARRKVPAAEGRGGGRARILAAATELFGTKGFSDVSMQDVARAAGVTKAALYYHFTDKVDLYTTVALARIESIHRAMDEASGGGGTLEERLVRLAMVGFERLQTDVYAPHINAHEHLDDAHHQQLHKAMDRPPGAGHPLLRRGRAARSRCCRRRPRPSSSAASCSR